MTIRSDLSGESTNDDLLWSSLSFYATRDYIFYRLSALICLAMLLTTSSSARFCLSMLHATITSPDALLLSIWLCYILLTTNDYLLYSTLSGDAPLDCLLSFTLSRDTTNEILLIIRSDLSGDSTNDDLLCSSLSFYATRYYPFYRLSDLSGDATND